MSTNLLSKAAGNPDLDNVFDPYVQGSSPGLTGLNVGGTSTDINTRYAPIVFGSAAAATGFNIKGTATDINTLFAAKGTASYSLPFQGGTYTAGHTTAGSVSVSGIGFQTNNSQCQVVDTNFGANDSPIYSIPTGATKVRFTMTLVTVNGSGTTVTNDATGFVALSGTVLQGAINTFRPPPAGSPPQNATYRILVEYQNAAGATISSTTFQLVTATS